MKNKISKSRKNIAPQIKLTAIWIIPLFAFLVKVFIIARIQGEPIQNNSIGALSYLENLLSNKVNPQYAWYGADGENYVDALLGLVRDGFYSSQGTLSYWPAGYPLFLWLFTIIFGIYGFLALTIFQSAIFAFGTFLFAREISFTRLRVIAVPFAVIISFNPTLSLNTISIGYELPVVSCFIIAVALFLKNWRMSQNVLFNRETVISLLFLAIATLMQPRVVILGIFILIFWAFTFSTKKKAMAFLILTTMLISTPLSILIHRNEIANGYATISTNLGSTINIGIGPNASGGYEDGRIPIDCPAADRASNPAIADRERVKCALLWQLQNPTKTLVLFANKVRFFWSPWFGPEANGTMARNPWALNHPLKSILSNPDGLKLLTGTFGKIVSWIWMLLGIALIVRGYFTIWRLGVVEKIIGLLSLSIVMVNLATSMLTIGDHRFRIPTMGFSLFLQVIGWYSIFSKTRFKSWDEKEARAWPGFSWNLRGRNANLRPSTEIK